VVNLFLSELQVVRVAVAVQETKFPVRWIIEVRELQAKEIPAAQGETAPQHSQKVVAEAVREQLAATLER
jgi:hypothetical protein